MKTEANEAANPTTTANYMGANDGNTPGLTKREYFAAMAMQGVVMQGEHTTNSHRTEFTAKDAVQYADALIEALNAEKEKL